MKTIKILSRMLPLALCLVVTSCMSTKDILYLQDMGQDSQIKLENKFQAVISPYDELTVIVSCNDVELAKPFNITAVQQQISNQSTQGLGYLVDDNGNIEMPELGQIHVAGLTRLELQDTLVARLRDGGFLEDPYVMVRFNNFKVFYLDNVGEKARVLDIPDERCTLFEALSMLGDLGVYTDHNKIGVMREVNGKMTLRYLDPRDSKVFNDPFFMLQQKDIIITQPIKSYLARQEVEYWISWVSVLTSLTSIATLFVLIKNGYVVY